MYLKSWAFVVCSGFVFVEASTNITSQTTGHAITYQPLVTPGPTASSCGACTYQYDVHRGFWDTNEIYTQTAALVELIIDDSTNTTSTSTIRNASLPLPTYTIDDSVVNGTVATLTLGSFTTYMTYPTWYDIFYNYSATFQSLATITGNGTSSVICTGEWKSYTEAFANTTEGPNGDYSPSTVVDALNAFTSSAFPGCTLDAKPVLAAPSTKVRVSQVTATSTRHVATLPDDGTGLSAESGGPGVPASPTSCGEYAITYTHTSGLEVTTGCIGAAASGPVVHHTVTGGLHPTPSKSEQQTGAGSVTKKPVYGGITLPFFGPIGARPTEQPSPRPTGSPGSGGDSGGQPVVALPITQSPSQGQGESSDQDGSNDQDGFNDQDESILPSPTIVTPPAQITINSKTYTLNPSSQFIIGSQTLSAGSHEITINGHTLSLASSASSIIIDGSTHAISYPPVTTLSPTAAPILTINHQPVTANSASEYVIGSQTLIPGGSAITISGTPVSLASSAADVVVGSSSTQALGEIIMGGFGPGGTAGSGGSGSGSANSTSTTSPEAFTGGAALVKKIHNWGVVLAGIGFGMVMG